MKKEEINEFIEERFKKINKYFHKAIKSFDLEDIGAFRLEVKKLKVFFHLLNMESEDGFSFHITKRMKTIYGYLGIVHNFQLQLKKTNEYVKKIEDAVPLCYRNVLRKELEYWVSISQDFIAADDNFLSDKDLILATLPDKLTKKSIKKFIDYTLHGLNTISGRLDDEDLENVRKFMEDIYYNYDFIKPYFTEPQTNLFNRKKVGSLLELFNNYRDKCMALALLQMAGTDGLEDHEKVILKQIENDWLYEKKELKHQLSCTREALQITVKNLNSFAFAGSHNV
jgi:CHAD domain-containing protein